jgi:hypothetical protein
LKPNVFEIQKDYSLWKIVPKTALVPKKALEIVPKTAPTKDNKKIYIPTLEEVTQYIKLKDYKLDPEEFYDAQQMRGWVVKVGNMTKPIANWKNAVNTFERNRKKWAKGKSTASTPKQKLLYDYGGQA